MNDGTDHDGEKQLNFQKWESWIFLTRSNHPEEGVPAGVFSVIWAHVSISVSWSDPQPVNRSEKEMKFDNFGKPMKSLTWNNRTVFSQCIQTGNPANRGPNANQEDQSMREVNAKVYDDERKRLKRMRRRRWWRRRAEWENIKTRVYQMILQFWTTTKTVMVRLLLFSLGWCNGSQSQFSLLESWT